MTESSSSEELSDNSQEDHKNESEGKVKFDTSEEQFINLEEDGLAAENIILRKQTICEKFWPKIFKK